MASNPPDQHSRKRKADEMDIDPPNTDGNTKKAHPVQGNNQLISLTLDFLAERFPIRQVIDQHPAAPGPTVDAESWKFGEAVFKRIVETRTRTTRDRISAHVAAVGYTAADLAVSVTLGKKMIAEAIKKAMVWDELFAEGHESVFLVRFKIGRSGKHVQSLRILFPGAGKEDGLGKTRGWRVNKYSAREFQDLLGTELLTRVSFFYAELTDEVKMCINLEDGMLWIAGKYCQVTEYPWARFSKIRTWG